MSDHALTVTSLTLTAVFGLLMLADMTVGGAVRGRVAASSARRARRRSAALSARLATLAGRLREPWRLEVRLLHAIVQAIMLFAVAFLLIVSALLPVRGEAGRSWSDLLAYVLGLALFFGECYAAGCALDEALDVMRAATRTSEIVALLARLGRRYPELAPVADEGAALRDRLAPVAAVMAEDGARDAGGEDRREQEERGRVGREQG